MPELHDPTPYADVNAVLHAFAAQIRASIGTQLRGMYLTGSLALGDFDPQSSDIDFIVVTDAALSPNQVAALQAMHARFAGSGSPWAERIEAVYVPAEALRRYPPAPIPYPQVEKDRPFFVEPLESGWIFQCAILRDHGVVVAGRAPRTLLAPIDPEAMRRAAAPIAELWLDQAQHDPSWLDWLRPQGNQAFVVLTLCRLLYTLDTGAVASKPEAARWAARVLGPHWAGLLARALARQHADGDAPEPDVADTVALIQLTVDRFQQELPHPPRRADGPGHHRPPIVL